MLQSGPSSTRASATPIFVVVAVDVVASKRVCSIWGRIADNVAVVLVTTTPSFILVLFVMSILFIDPLDSPYGTARNSLLARNELLTFLPSVSSNKEGNLQLFDTHTLKTLFTFKTNKKSTKKITCILFTYDAENCIRNSSLENVNLKV